MKIDPTQSVKNQVKLRKNLRGTGTVYLSNKAERNVEAAVG